MQNQFHLPHFKINCRKDDYAKNNSYSNPSDIPAPALFPKKGEHPVMGRNSTLAQTSPFSSSEDLNKN